MMKLDEIFYKLHNYYGPQHWWPAESNIEMMIGSILVQNTSWVNVEKALANFEYFEGSKILEMNPEVLLEWVRLAGFFTRKAQTVINVLTWFRGYDFDVRKLQDIPTLDVRKELLAIHGIGGEETCDCILLYMLERPVFVVDSYLRRLLKKMGHPEFKKYTDVQKYMMERLPQDVELFQEYHALVVEYGKTYLGKKVITGDPLIGTLPTVQYSLFELYELMENPIMENLVNELGYVERIAYPDPFWGVIHTIVGQLIGSYAAKAIWKRFADSFPTKASLQVATIDEIKEPGLTKSKATYIYDFVKKVNNGAFDLQAIETMSTQDAINYLCTLKGIGIWSAKIILMHSYHHLDFSPFEDVALRNAVKKLQNLPKVSKEDFAAFFKQFKPYQSVVCIYLWKY